MSSESRAMAGLLTTVLPTVVFGGVSMLYLWLGRNSDYMKNPLRQSLWRAGHAHAGVLLVASLLTLLYVDSAALSDELKSLVRSAIPLSAILLPAAFFLLLISLSHFFIEFRHTDQTGSGDSLTVCTLYS